jgi:hypothetical protein
MKVNELRIGNYLLCGNKTDLLGDLRRVVMVLGVDNSSIMYCENYETSGVFKSSFLAENFSPIPLTEEWLVRFGLEKREPDDDYNYWGILNFTVLYGRTMDRDFSFFLNGYHNDCNIQYVHQLQNLYFALTGEELTLDK